MTHQPLPASPQKRILYLDALRVLAAFLVIVNHTNSYVFQAATPAGFTWYLSIAWYYLSKIAVPLFVMVAGACLLPKQDSYRRVGVRILRLVIALVLFSYLYYVVGVWQSHEPWQRALDIPGFLASIWVERIADSFWYLYFYIGLMVMLPLLQRMASSMKKSDLLYLMGISFGINALWPLLVHYVPAMKLPDYFDLPLFSIFIGLFFAGHYLHAYARPKPWHLWACIAAIVLSVLLSTGLTLLEYNRVAPGAKYWFMDERTAPSITIVVCSLATMYGARCISVRRGAKNKPLSSRASHLILTLGKCSFGIYLLQDLLIAETRYRMFVPLCSVINPFAAALLWELLVFVAAAAIAWLLRRIPRLRKIL